MTTVNTSATPQALTISRLTLRINGLEHIVRSIRASRCSMRFANTSV
jgi:hypothetical protein